MSKQIIVEKRDGSKVEYDVLKTKESIRHATKGLDVNPLQLESTLDQFVKTGIKTQDIQKNIVQHALQLANETQPEWLKVAGRAYAADQWASFKLKGKTFLEIVKHNIKKGDCTSDLTKFYTDSEIEEIGRYVDYTNDLAHTYESLYSARKKYLGTHELNQHMHIGNAMRWGQKEPQETRLEFVKEVYHALAKRKLSPATPIMSNLRKGGNVASCFIIAINDDLDSIFDNVKRMARISKNGGGIGCYLGKLRAKGSSVNGVPNASGTIVQWVKIINDTAIAVNQGGKRAGAVTTALPIWHNDILDFLDMQTEHGDLRLKAFDVFPQIVVPDLFMRRDKAKSKFVTFCPFEVKQKLGIEMYGLWGGDFESAYEKIEAAFYAGKLKVARELDARTLMKAAMKTMFDTGLPYVAFIDEINRQNPNKHEGFIPCVNLCTESFSNVVPDEFGHVCNLASVVLGNIDSLEELAKISRLATKILEYSIELTNSPDQITEKHNQRYRTIGIGIQGLHDNLAKTGKTFSDLEYIREIAEVIEYNAIKQSVELAKVFGAYPAFIGSEWATGERLKRFAEHSNNKEMWVELQKEIDKYGVRNSQLTSPAPNTTTSIYQDSSASILPSFKRFFIDDNQNGSMKIAAKFLKEFPEGYARELPDYEPEEIIDVTAELQKFFDTGVSMELLFDQNKPNFKAKNLYDAIHYAHGKNIKAIYYIRSIKKNEVAEREEAACDACAG